MAKEGLGETFQKKNEKVTGEGGGDAGVSEPER